MTKNYIAHIRSSDNKEQTLEEHLQEVGEISGNLSEKIGVREAGILLGLLHDYGKYSKAFQDYIKSAEELINPDEDGYVEADKLKGKIDHSSAGAQLIWQPSFRTRYHCRITRGRAPRGRVD